MAASFNLISVIGAFEDVAAISVSTPHTLNLRRVWLTRLSMCLVYVDYAFNVEYPINITFLLVQ